MTTEKSDKPQGSIADKKPDRAVSLAPLKLKDALTALFAIPDPDATKPAIKGRKKSGRSK